ncbi:hypothetical protein QYF61_024025 [Mycteria americana]|uniref:Uncharacterized protein n=1 Tax=Mycteria americana TaxID=33587 RepID=A0AAN7S0L6_MYCAM|nr:hypothetical protein QYF61_024025 [Mycteria americana]
MRINSATCLPNTPVPIEVLQIACSRLLQIQISQLPTSSNSWTNPWNSCLLDVNVLLAGTRKPGELQRCLRGPPLEIEVHDRDRNMESNTKKLCLFGEDEADERVGRYLAISAPIHNCSAPHTAAFREEDRNEKTIESVSSSSLLPMGHYLESDSLLKVRLEIAVPLGMHAEIADAQVINCPYGCIIYTFDYNNSSLLHHLVAEITEINAKALQLDCYPVHLIGMALAALKLKTTFEKVSELDIGLKDKAIKKLRDKHFERTYRHEDGQLEILYNSQLSFPQRLYTELEAIFYHFCLCKPLFTGTKQPLLYARASLTLHLMRWIVDEESGLSCLCHSERLRDAILGGLLPAAEVIAVLSHKYGVPLSDEGLFIQKPPLLSLSSDDYAVPGKVSRVTQAVDSSLRNYNETRVQQKKETADKVSFERNRVGVSSLRYTISISSPEPLFSSGRRGHPLESACRQAAAVALAASYARANLGAVCQLKGKMKKPKFEAFRISPVDGKAVFNYSSQSLNSAELAKKHLRQEMEKGN